MSRKLSFSNPFSRSRGFTLIELAIVLVIIGLIVTIILVGRDLITQAQISRTVTKIQEYNGVVSTFKSKYIELPGDISRAAKFGLNTEQNSTIVNVCSTNTTPVTATAGGNGNGNNIIQGHDVVGTCTQGSMSGAAANFNYAAFGGEVANFFVHLSNAGFIKGSFKQPTIPQEVGTSFPEMPVGNGMIAISDSGLVYWVLGTPVTITNNLGEIIGNRLSPKEAYALDQKLDDGNPTQGIVQAVSAYNVVFTIVSPGVSSCIFTDGTYNTLGTVKNSGLCTLRIQGGF